MPQNKALFCSLGRAGDVLNSLPLAWDHWQRTGEKPYFQTARAYAGLLDGVSYVEPVIYEGDFKLTIPALWQARQLTEDIRLCQIYGVGISTGETCSSFARQSWLSAGATVPWGSLPLILDRRDAQREAELLGRFCLPFAPTKLVLVALNGQSSPFPYREHVMETLRTRLGFGYEVFELSKVNASRFQDLLAFFDIAHCLVTIDTGHLHLAHASQVPVISFVTRDPTPWHGSPWRPNHIGRFFYDETLEAMPRVLELIERAQDPTVKPKIIHTWSDWREGKPDAELLRRNGVAQSSWQTEYTTGYWIPAEHKRTPGTRTGKDIGDPHAIAFAHDTIENGIARATSDDDIICLTNADTGFTPGLTGHIIEKIERFECAWSHRRDFDRIEKPFHSEAQVRTGKWYPGTDLFCFTVRWWKAHKHEYADYVFGREAWDEVLRQLMKFHGGACLEIACWHEWHVSFWSAELRDTLPGNVHNKRLRAEWFAKTGFIEEDFRYFRTSENSHLHPHPQPPRL